MDARVCGLVMHMQSLMDECGPLLPIQLVLDLVCDFAHMTLAFLRSFCGVLCFVLLHRAVRA